MHQIHASTACLRGTELQVRMLQPFRSELLSIGQVADTLLCLPAALQQECLGHIGDMEAAMVKEFPYQVPSEFKDLPQLKVCSSQLQSRPVLQAMPQPTADPACRMSTHVPSLLFTCLCKLHGSAGPVPACWHLI